MYPSYMALLGISSKFRGKKKVTISGRVGLGLEVTGYSIADMAIDRPC